jgi:hypothetical protein
MLAVCDNRGVRRSAGRSQRSRRRPLFSVDRARGPSNQPEARLPPLARGETLVLRRIQPAPTPPPGPPMPAFDERRAICRLHRALLPSGLSAPGKVPAAARQGKRQRVDSRLQSRGRVGRRTPGLALSLPVPVQPGHLHRPGWSRLRGNAERRCRSVPRLAPKVKAAAIPRPSPIPPVAMIGTDSLSANRGQESEKPHGSMLGGRGIKCTAVAAGLRTLRHDGVGTRGNGPRGLRQASSHRRTRRCRGL